jgi:DNA-binding GntR family transcriptional regulator
MTGNPICEAAVATLCLWTRKPTITYLATVAAQRKSIADHEEIIRQLVRQNADAAENVMRQRLVAGGPSKRGHHSPAAAFSIP